MSQQASAIRFDLIFLLMRNGVAQASFADRVPVILDGRTNDGYCAKPPPNTKAAWLRRN
jgi:hypothetical protein